MPSLRHSRPLQAVLLILMLALHGCAVLEPEPDAADRRALSRARSLWQRVGPTSYRYVYAARCGMCSPYAARATWVTVEKGRVIDAAYVESNEPINESPQVFGTVDSLFALVQRAYDEHASEVRVQYDATLGYPTDVWVDWRGDMADDEGGFSASALTPYAPVAPSLLQARARH